MEDSHGGFSGGGSGGRKKVLETEDLQEEEVWAMMEARKGSNSNSKSRKNFASGSTSSSSAWRVNATPRSIPRVTTTNGGGQQEFSPAEVVARHQSSAPVDIPQLSKILKKKSKKDLWDDACDWHNDDGDDDHGDGGRRFGHGKVDEVESDDDDEMAPPHEYLARRLASTRIASFSMCEGVGRTLKGRDLSKLRNAILTKTGFIE